MAVSLSITTFYIFSFNKIIKDELSFFPKMAMVYGSIIPHILFQINWWSSISISLGDFISVFSLIY